MLSIILFWKPFHPELQTCVQERQTILRHWLNDLRAWHGERVAGINFREGQPISKSVVLGKQTVKAMASGC